MCYHRVVKGGFFLGTALTTVFTVLWKIIRFVAEIIAKIIYYFGLYVPILYLIYGAVLHWIYGFKLFDLSTDSKLYILGLSLCGIIAVMLSVRSLIIRPYRKYFKRTDVIEYGKKQRLKKAAPEAPSIYKSKVNKGVIVYEYENRYDLYEERENGLYHVETEYKKQKGRRW